MGAQVNRTGPLPAGLDGSAAAALDDDDSGSRADESTRDFFFLCEEEIMNDRQIEPGRPGPRPEDGQPMTALYLSVGPQTYQPMRFCSSFFMGPRINTAHELFHFWKPAEIIRDYANQSNAFF